MVHSSVDSAEVAKFSRIAEEWWDPAGKFGPLHKFNPIRLGFIRRTAADHFGRNRTALQPFAGLSLLDIGCGGGLVSEPMAKMGFAVTGVDPSQETIGVATAHAAMSAAQVAYRAVEAEVLKAEGATFDVVLNLEVVEHVADLAGYLHTCAALVKPGGLMFVATLNRTLKSFALAKVAVEYVLRWVPAGTHDWNSFVTPERLRELLEESGLNTLKTQGMAFDPLSWDWRLSADTDVNYMVVAGKPV